MLISSRQRVRTLDSIARTSARTAAYCRKSASSAATLSADGGSAAGTGVEARGKVLGEAGVYNRS